MSTYATNGDPAAKPATNGQLGPWAQNEGLVLDQLLNGVDAASGQLSPGLWLSACQAGNATRTGWTQAYLRQFLAFLDSKGVRSIDMWTGARPTSHSAVSSSLLVHVRVVVAALVADQLGDGTGCPMPCPAAPTCDWAYSELRAWKRRG